MLVLSCKQRDALVTIRTELRNQHQALIQQSVVVANVWTRLEQLIAHLDSEIVAVEQEIRVALILAPNPYQSGTSVRGRTSIGRGGNARLRRVLYLAALLAARHNPTIQAFYERLRAAGKPLKVARCAAARKLLHSAWAVVTED